jgi:hypothetical protein
LFIGDTKVYCLLSQHLEGINLDSDSSSFNITDPIPVFNFNGSEDLSKRAISAAVETSPISDPVHDIILSNTVLLSNVSSKNDGDAISAAPRWEQVVDECAVLIERGGIQLGNVAETEAPPGQTAVGTIFNVAWFTAAWFQLPEFKELSSLVSPIHI